MADAVDQRKLTLAQVLSLPQVLEVGGPGHHYKFELARDPHKMNAQDVQTLIRAEVAGLSRALQVQADQTAALARRSDQLEALLAKTTDKAAKALEWLGSVAKVVDSLARQGRAGKAEEERESQQKELLRFVDRQVVKAVDSVMKERQGKTDGGAGVGSWEREQQFVAAKEQESGVADQVSRIERDFHRIELQFRGDLDKLSATLGGLRESLHRVQAEVRKDSLAGQMTPKQLETPHFASKMAFESFVEKVGRQLAQLGAELWEVKARMHTTVPPPDPRPAEQPVQTPEAASLPKPKKKVGKASGLSLKRLRSPPPKEGPLGGRLAI